MNINNFVSSFFTLLTFPTALDKDGEEKKRKDPSKCRFFYFFQKILGNFWYFFIAYVTSLAISEHTHIKKSKIVFVVCLFACIEARVYLHACGWRGACMCISNVFCYVKQITYHTSRANNNRFEKSITLPASASSSSPPPSEWWCLCVCIGSAPLRFTSEYYEYIIIWVGTHLICIHGEHAKKLAKNTIFIQFD